LSIRTVFEQFFQEVYHVTSLSCDRFTLLVAPSTYRNCYWCDRSIKLGVDIFGLDKLTEQPAVNAKTVEGILTIDGHSNWTNSIVYSPNSNTLTSVSRDQVIKLWNTSTGGLIKILTRNSDWVNALGYSPDRKILLSGSGDKTIKLWNVSIAREIHTLRGYFNSVRCLVYSPDGKILASGSADNGIKLWPILSRTVLSSPSIPVSKPVRFHTSTPKSKLVRSRPSTPVKTIFQD
jgi:WD40 repeat protein